MKDNNQPHVFVPPPSTLPPPQTLAAAVVADSGGTGSGMSQILIFH